MREQRSVASRIDVRQHIIMMNRYFIRDSQRWVLTRSMRYRESDVYDLTHFAHRILSHIHGYA